VTADVLRCNANALEPVPLGVHGPEREIAPSITASGFAGLICQSGWVQQAEGSLLDSATRRCARNAVRSAVAAPGSSTPCSDLTAIDVAVHLVEVVEHFAAHESAGPDDGTLASRLAAAGEALRRRWRELDPGAQWTVLLEMVVHSWDVSVAVEVSPDIPNELATEILSGSRALLDRFRRVGTFAGPLVGEWHRPVDQLIAETGRRPDWSDGADE